MFSKIPREAKKNDPKLESKDMATVSTAVHAVHKSDGNLGKENVPRKNVAPKGLKGASSRYGHQAELKEQNLHLMAVNEEVQKNLSETQQKVSELELQFNELKKENVEIQKDLQDCHVLLVSAKIDPVSGERVGDTAQQKKEQRKEIMSVSTDLLRELKAFGDTASEQRARLEEIQSTMVDFREAREHMKGEREKFMQQTADLEKALTEAEALLL